MLDNPVKQMLLGIICLWIIILPMTAIAQADKIYEKNNQAVVQIFTYNKKGKSSLGGSGFIVRSDGAIVTSFHVVSEATSIKAKTAEDKYFEVEGVLYSNAANDLIILKAKGEDLPVVKLGDSDKIKPGEKVYLMGRSRRLGTIINEGIISGIEKLGQNQRIIQTTARIPPGTSGGPLFNEKGEVIAVGTSKTTDRQTGIQTRNFATPVNLLKDGINNRNILSLEKTTADYMNTAEYWYWKGGRLREAGKDKEEMESYKKAIRINPDFSRACYTYNSLGVAYRKLGNYKKAMESYKEAIRIKPDYAKAYNNLGLAYGKSGDYKKAIELFKEAIRLEPDDTDAYYNLGLAYTKSGDYQKAIESYKEAIRIKPDDTRAYQNLGVTYCKLEEWKKAIESLKETICLKPDYAKAYYALGFAYHKAGDRDKALEEYQILKDLDKDWAEKLLEAIDESQDKSENK